MLYVQCFHKDVTYVLLWRSLKFVAILIQLRFFFLFILSSNTVSISRALVSNGGIILVDNELTMKYSESDVT